MKNLILFFGFFLTITAAYAQTMKGSFLVGGNLAGLSLNKQSASISIAPQGGWFVADNFALGLSIPVSYSRFNGSVSQSSSTSFGISPFVRYYFRGGKLRPFVAAFYSFQQNNSTFTSGGDESKSTGRSSIAGASAGVAYFITDSVGLEATLNGYQSFDPGLFTFNVNLGFQIYLPQK